MWECWANWTICGSVIIDGITLVCSCAVLVHVSHDLHFPTIPLPETRMVAVEVEFLDPLDLPQSRDLSMSEDKGGWGL